jgi:glycosyltransferase involved in cell wall biosynthesis
VRFEFLSSTPAGPTEGSGTWVALDGLARGLERLGHTVVRRPLGRRTGFHTLDRWIYNAQVAARPPAADVVVGVDLDGWLWARHLQTRRRSASAGPPALDGRATPRFVVALKGIIADELRNERGLVRWLLARQACWERLNTERADRVVVPSRYSAAVAREAYGVPAERLAVVPEPIDLAEWRRRFAAAARVPRRAPTVLSVARMYPRKRLEDLLRAAVRLRERIRGVRVRIVGEGPESGRLRALHAALGLGDSVTFLGDISRQALAVEYVGADCFCLPTVQEGFGIVFTEAMAAGLAIVACRAAAVPELVDDGRTGLLVSPRSPEELAMALESLLENPGLRADLGAAGAARVAAFDLEPVARRFVEAAGA